MKSDPTGLIETTLAELAEEFPMFRLDELLRASRTDLQRASLLLIDIICERGLGHEVMDRGRLAALYRKGGHSRAARHYQALEREALAAARERSGQ